MELRKEPDHSTNNVFSDFLLNSGLYETMAINEENVDDWYAILNGSGGKIIFGVADKTREVIGFGKEDVFKIMDAIANAVSDSCEPAIIPDITLQTIDGKTVIVVEVFAGRQRPYYIKSLGKEAGVYVRVAGTTRLADEYMVKELMFEGSNRHFDQTLCTGWNITDEDVDALCKAMKEQAVKNAHSEEQKAAIKDVGRQQLRSWGVLVERDGKDYPSNAYAILTGCGALNVVMQCGVFKGTTKEIFVDRRQYDGPIWEQIEQAYQFVLRNIHMGATFEGIYRQDVYEIPPDAIRELIINAAVHRSYLDHGNIQIAIYDNRLEITSPGKIPMGQTLERMILSSLVIIGLPLIITQMLGFDSETANRFYGYAESVFAMGSLCGGMGAGLFAQKIKARNGFLLLLYDALTLIPIGIAIMIPMQTMISYIIILISCFCMAFLSTLFSIQIMSYLQMIVPVDLIGKVISCAMCIGMCASPIGQAMYGGLFEVFGERVFALFFAAALLIVILAVSMKRTFIRLEKLLNGLAVKV